MNRMKTFVTLLFTFGLLAVGCNRQESTPTPPAPPEETPRAAAPPRRPTLPPVTPPATAPVPALPPTAVPALNDYIALDEAQRMAVVSAVAAHAPDQAATKLGDLLRVEPSAHIKTAILDELGFLEHTAALQPILGTFDTTQPEPVREAAIDAADTLLSDLANADNPTAFATILQALDARYPAEVRQAAISALEDLEDPRAIPHLTRLLSDPNPEIQQTAADAIDWLQKE